MTASGVKPRTTPTSKLPAWSLAAKPGLIRTLLSKVKVSQTTVMNFYGSNFTRAKNTTLCFPIFTTVISSRFIYPFRPIDRFAGSCNDKVTVIINDECELIVTNLDWTHP